MAINSIAIKRKSSLKYWLFIISGQVITVHYSDTIRTIKQAEAKAIRLIKENL